MPCVFPIPARRGEDYDGRAGMIFGRELVGFSGNVRDVPDSVADEVLANPFLLFLPCGSCVGCQIARARSWAIRCSLELQLHSVASFVTLTYADRYVPPTLSRLHLSRFFRYLRRDVGAVRFFACGEYGELRQRPHYHALVFGSSSREAFEDAWGSKGFVTAEAVTPERVSYTAGYCAKKLGFFRPKGEEVDYSTGEVYEHQPPFLQMSRGGRPKDGVRQHGIAGEFRKHWRSWRSSAVWQGKEFPVPRFLHASYKESASDSELAALELEKLESRMQLTVSDLRAHEQIGLSRVRLRTERAQL